MTSPHADGPETDKAAWAGGDAETVDAAEAIDDFCRRLQQHTSQPITSPAEVAGKAAVL